MTQLLYMFVYTGKSYNLEIVLVVSLDRSN